MRLNVTGRKNLYVLVAVMAAAIVATFAYTGIAAGDDHRDNNGNRYEVTITNVTKGQVLSPAVIATHRGSLAPVFALGEPASDELAGVAEDADLPPLVEMLEDDSAVANVVVLTGVNGPILPGETASVVIRGGKKANELSLVSMLVTTNDVFTGLSGVRLPNGRAGDMHRTVGYDAGTEANNEDCAFIPGPPCGNAGVRDTAGAEGYVYVSNGVHGIASLDPATHDWHNPVAQVKIRRIRGGDDD